MAGTKLSFRMLILLLVAMMMTAAAGHELHGSHVSTSRHLPHPQADVPQGWHRKLLQGFGELSTANFPTDYSHGSGLTPGRKLAQALYGVGRKLLQGFGGLSVADFPVSYSHDSSGLTAGK